MNNKEQVGEGYLSQSKKGNKFQYPLNELSLEKLMSILEEVIKKDSTDKRGHAAIRFLGTEEQFEELMKPIIKEHRKKLKDEDIRNIE